MFLSWFCSYCSKNRPSVKPLSFTLQLHFAKSAPFPKAEEGAFLI